MPSKIRIEWNAEAVKDTALKCLSEQLLHDVGLMPAIEPPAAPALSPVVAAAPAEPAPAAYGYVTVAGVENLPPLAMVESAPVQETGGLTPPRSPERARRAARRKRLFCRANRWLAESSNRRTRPFCDKFWMMR